MLRSIRTVLVVQTLNSCVSGILAVSLPIMMKERQIDILFVGFVFGAMPLVMQLGRMVFAVLSDSLGRKIFFVSNGVIGILSNLTYLIAHTPLEYLFGKVLEGTKEGTLWAVNRPFLLEESGGKRQVLSYMRAVHYTAYAAGSFLAGFLIVYGYSSKEQWFCA